MSKNVSLGSTLELTCGTNYDSLTILWFSDLSNAVITTSLLLEGGKLSTLSATIQKEDDPSNIVYCYLIGMVNNTKISEGHSALISIQGM